MGHLTRRPLQRPGPSSTAPLEAATHDSASTPTPGQRKRIIERTDNLAVAPKVVSVATDIPLRTEPLDPATPLKRLLDTLAQTGA